VTRRVKSFRCVGRRPQYTHGTVASPTPFIPLPTPHSSSIQKPSDFESNGSIISSHTGAPTSPCISTSRPITPLSNSNRHFSDERAEFVAGLYRQWIPASDVARVVVVRDEGSSVGQEQIVVMESLRLMVLRGYNHHLLTISRLHESGVVVWEVLSIVGALRCLLCMFSFGASFWVIL
jgi:hypothetical protein